MNDLGLFSDMLSTGVCTIRHYLPIYSTGSHDISQDLGTGCPKLAIVKFWGVLFFKEATTYMYSDYNNKHVSTY